MRRRGESGFALLLVFLMAAVVAITLYTEIPRVAFETQRQKEQLLIERGEQYKRAIYMFYKANSQRYPGKIEDLENFNGRRFLRHRYIDPMTGKEEWRLVHIQNGMLTDSVTMKQKQGDGKQGDGKQGDGKQADGKQVDSTAGQYVAEQLGIGQVPANQPGVSTNRAFLRRPSENAGAAGMTGTEGQTGATGTTGADSGQSGAQASGSPVLPPGMPGALSGQTGSTGSTGTTGASSYVGGGYPLGGAGTPPSSQTTSSSSPYSLGAGPGSQPAGNASNAAADMINKILTTPRGSGQASTGQVLGGGIAGIASTADSDSIMVYNDRSNYSEWEFIFDPFKQKVPPNPITGGPSGATSAGSQSTGSKSGSTGTSSMPFGK
jgi:hypothetical protein